MSGKAALVRVFDIVVKGLSRRAWARHHEARNSEKRVRLGKREAGGVEHQIHNVNGHGERCRSYHNELDRARNLEIE